MSASPRPVSRFLSKSGISKEECDVIAKSLSSSIHVVPTAVQGANSYTVQGGELVVQFRSAEVDLRVHNKAMEIHGSAYVPPITYVQSDPFYVYTSPYRGKSHSEHGISNITLSIRRNTIIDLATFFAQSCHHTVDHDQMDLKLDIIEAFLQDCLNLPDVKGQVQNLLDNLGISQSHKFNNVDKLDDLPVVLVHGDLGQLNILTSDEGHITGILDWNGSQYLPFGWNLYGLEEFLGFASLQDGWVNRKERGELEEVFWETFWESAPAEILQKQQRIEAAVKISKGIGVLWNNVGDEGVERFLENYSNFMIIIKGQL